MVATVSTRLQQNYRRQHNYIKSRYIKGTFTFVFLIWGRVPSHLFNHHLTYSKTLVVPVDYGPFEWGFVGVLTHDSLKVFTFFACLGPVLPRLLISGSFYHHLI